MRVDGIRTKKLIVAFHFQLSNISGWSCDGCRKDKLEQKRRCGWLAWPPPENGRPIWTRQGTFTLTCPKSEMDPESLKWIEWYCVAKRIGSTPLVDMAAKDADVFLILEGLVQAEQQLQNKRTQC